MRVKVKGCKAIYSARLEVTKSTGVKHLGNYSRDVSVVWIGEVFFPNFYIECPEIVMSSWAKIVIVTSPSCEVSTEKIEESGAWPVSVSSTGLKWVMAHLDCVFCRVTV